MKRYFNFLRSIIFWSTLFFQLFLITLLIPILGFSIEQKKKIFQSWAQTACKISLKLSFFIIKINGFENIEKDTGFIIAANHSSFIDSIVLLGILPFQFKFVADSSGFSLPFFGRLYKAAYWIKKDNKMKFKDQVVLYNALKKNERVVIYSSVAKKWELSSFSEAVIKYSNNAGSPILPVAIKGASKTLPMKKFIFEDNRIEVKIGKARYFSDAQALYDEVERLYNPHPTGRNL